MKSIILIGIVFTLITLSNSLPPMILQLPLNQAYLSPKKSKLTSQNLYISPNNLYLPASEKLREPLNRDQKTLVIKIRSDQRVPIVLKKGPMYRKAIRSNQQTAIMSKPMKIAILPQLALKDNLLLNHIPKQALKIKLTSSRPNSFPEKPYTYEKPIYPVAQELPIKNPVQFSTNYTAPIRTIPAPNLFAIVKSQKQQEIAPPYTLPLTSTSNFRQNYEVTEDYTNDQTIVDASGFPKYFAPDPDPSLPTAKIRPSIEIFNTPSNGKPLPHDVQSQFLPSIVQFQPATHQQIAINSERPISAYQIPFQEFVPQNAPFSVYNPTYLVTQSKNLYQLHQAQKSLFEPNMKSVYGNDDLTQEVASNGQILQSAKDHANQIHPAFSGTTQTSTLAGTPHFAALIAAPIFDATLKQNLQYDDGNFYSQINNPNAEYSNLEGNFPQIPNSFEAESSQRQIGNNIIIPSQQQSEVQNIVPEQITSPTTPDLSAYEQHQRLLQKQLQPLRIFVPDDDGKTNLQKRSDDNDEESKTILEDLEDNNTKVENYDDKK